MVGGIRFAFKFWGLQSSSALKTEGNGKLHQEAPAPQKKIRTDVKTVNVSLVQNTHIVALCVWTDKSDFIFKKQAKMS